MKNYVFGFTTDSGELIAIGEFGCDGKTLVVTASDHDAAWDVFRDYLDRDVLTEWLVDGAYVQTIDRIDDEHFLIINEEVQ